MTYDLRTTTTPRPHRTQPHTHRYRVTDHGFRTAALYSRTHNHILRPAMAELVRPIGVGPISGAIRHLDKALAAA